MLKSFNVNMLNCAIDPISKMIASMNDNDHSISEIEPGFYLIGDFSFDLTIERVIGRQLSFEEKFIDYGVCDCVNDIKQEHKELLDDEERQFVVSVTPVERANQPDEGGWRWHKWGPYIGSYEPQHEYLYDEDIDRVYVYHIYEIED